MNLRFLFLLLLLIPGCGNPSLSPVVFIDRDFGDRLPEVIAGVDAWAPAGSHPSVLVVSHQDALASNAPNTIAIVVTDSLQSDGSSGHTEHSQGHATIGIDMRSSTLNPFPGLIAHEMGHAFGLSHVSDPAQLMHHIVNVSAPTCGDYRQLHSVKPESLIPSGC